MNETVFLIAVLFGLIVAQQIQIHRLINKLMSRNYHEYTASNNPADPTPRVHLDEEPQEDLGAIPLP